jgi:peptidoglycan/LPS O-acetylase OafA/YrhL
MSTAILKITEEQPDRSGKRVRGLDTLRFFLALWVVAAHFWVPLGIDKSSAIGKLIIGIYTNFINGPAAVIVFFVISGFCIHYPFRHGKELALIPYFSRRHLRIWVPIIVAILCGIPLNVKFSFMERSIMWSLVAEEIYYLIYPLILAARRKFGWQKLLIFAYAGAGAIILSNPTINDYPSYGPYLTWLLGSPTWLLGCCLAERADKLCDAATHNPILHIWRWRFAAWMLSFICSAANFHSPLKFPLNLSLFAVFAFFWLSREIVYFQSHAPNRIFENAGKGSYSIYLFHLLAPPLYILLKLPTFSPVLQWCVQIAFSLPICYVFYLLVERPSHNLARKVAELLAPKSLRLDRSQSATYRAEP